MRRSAAPSQRKPSPEELNTKNNVGRVESIPNCNKISQATIVSNIVTSSTEFLSRNRLIPSEADEALISNSNNLFNDSPTVLNKTQFSAVWAKASSRKHKIWEGDCTVVTDGRKTIVKDSDGKILASSNNAFKNVAVSDIESGYRFMAGGKEIEICKFLSNNNDDDVEEIVPNKDTGLFGSAASNISSKFKRRRLSVAAAAADENAFILPRPSSSHVLKYNTHDDIVVDVTVDGHLARKLRGHQKDGVVFLYQCVTGLKNFDRFGAILADEMGLGKTLQCITCLWTLHNQGPFGGRPLVKRSLIVVPSSLVQNWMAEFKKWLGSERLKILAAKKSVDIKTFILNPLYSILIISYDLAVRCRDDLERLSFDLLICDEGHRLKNGNIKVATLLASLLVKRRILLSGTPVQNDLNELYTLADFVNPGIFGSRTDFRRNYEDIVVRSQQKDASSSEKELGALKAKELNVLMSQFLLRRTAELNEKYLPAKVEYVLFCKPSTVQLMLYEKMLNSKLFNDSLSTEYPSSFTSEHLICIDALRKLCNHPSLLYNSQTAKASTNNEVDELLELFPVEYSKNINRLGDSGKLFVLFELLSSVRQNFPKEKVVVVSNFTSTLDLIGALCLDMGYKFLRLDGSTVNSVRSKVVATFNSSYDDTFLFLLSSKAGGVGLNLIGANRIILYDIDWNPANDLQAMARIWRDGQKRVCHIYRLLTTGTIEEKMFQRQIKKQSLSGAVVDVETSAKALALSECVRFSPEELKDIFTFHTNTECQTHDLIKCHCNGTEPAVERLTEEEEEQEEDNSENEERKCQLGTVANSENVSKSRPCMARLLEWEHRSCSSNLPVEIPEESCIIFSENYLSYVFYMFHSARRIEEI